MEHAVGEHVDDEAHQRHGEHGERQDGFRFPKSTDCLIDDPRAQGEKRQGVDEGGKHLETVMAVGEAVRLPAPRQPHGVPREAQRRRIEEHVPGVGRQGERVADHGTDDLHPHERRDQPERTPEHPLVATVAIRIVASVHVHDEPRLGQRARAL